MDQTGLCEINGKALSLAGIRGACRFYGGVKAVANAAGFLPSSFTRWLKGRASLPEKHIEAVLDVLDLPEGQARTGVVLHWRYKVLWDDLSAALKLYFPSGAEVIRTPWSKPGISNALKFFSLDQIRSDKPPEIFLLRSTDVRAIVRQPPGFLLHEDLLGKGIKMKTVDGEVCEFSVQDGEAVWFRGAIKPKMFDQAFDAVDIGWDRVITVAQTKGIRKKQILDWLQEQ